MCFTSRAVYGARTFSCISVDTLNTPGKSHHRLRVNKLLQAELRWWTEFIMNWNGLCPCSIGLQRREVVIRTDASFFWLRCGLIWSLGRWLMVGFLGQTECTSKILSQSLTWKHPSKTMQIFLNWLLLVYQYWSRLRCYGTIVLLLDQTIHPPWRFYHLALRKMPLRLSGWNAFFMLRWNIIFM